MDIVRIFAIFWVIWNHSSTYGWQYWMGKEGPVRYVSLILSCFCKIAVPLFLMATGALLLSKGESVSVLLKKRVSRMIYLMLLVAVTVYLYWGPKWGYSLSLFDFLRRLYSSTAICSYFLWLYLGFLLALPMLREIVKNRKVMYYMIALFVLTEYVLPLFEYLFGLSAFRLASYAGLFQYYYIFPLIGYAIHSMDDSKITKKGLFILGVLAILTMIFLIWFRDTQERETGVENVKFDYLSIFMASFILYAARMLCRSLKGPAIAGKMIAEISSTSLGAFLISAYFVEPRVLTYTKYLNQYVHPLLSCLILCVAVLLISQAITALLRLIPPLRRIL